MQFQKQEKSFLQQWAELSGWATIRPRKDCCGLPCTQRMHCTVKTRTKQHAQYSSKIKSAKFHWNVLLRKGFNVLVMSSMHSTFGYINVVFMNSLQQCTFGYINVVWPFTQRQASTTALWQMERWKIRKGTKSIGNDTNAALIFIWCNVFFQWQKKENKIKIAHDVTIFIRLTFFKIVCFSDVHQDEGH